MKQYQAEMEESTAVQSYYEPKGSRQQSLRLRWLNAMRQDRDDD
jgi:hypothetical protein